MKFRNITGEGMQMCLKSFFCIISATHDVQWLNYVTVSCKIEVSHEKSSTILTPKMPKKINRGAYYSRPKSIQVTFRFQINVPLFINFQIFSITWSLLWPPAYSIFVFKKFKDFFHDNQGWPSLKLIILAISHKKTA